MAALRGTVERNVGCRKYFLPLSCSDFAYPAVLISKKTPGAWLTPFAGIRSSTRQSGFHHSFFGPILFVYFFYFIFTLFTRPGNVSGLHRRWAPRVVSLKLSPCLFQGTVCIPLCDFNTCILLWLYTIASAPVSSVASLFLERRFFHSYQRS